MPLLLLAVVLWQTLGPSDDFAFRLERTRCPEEIIDTFKATYSREVASRPASSMISTSLVLSPEQRQALFDVINAGQVFDYPSEFQGNVPEPGPGGSVCSCTQRWELVVRNAGRRHVVSFTYNPRRPLTLEAQRLERTIEAITKTIHAHPNVSSMGRFTPCID